MAAAEAAQSGVDAAHDGDEPEFPGAEVKGGDVGIEALGDSDEPEAPDPEHEPPTGPDDAQAQTALALASTAAKLAGGQAVATQGRTADEMAANLLSPHWQE
jgi:hypothetical protein